MRRVTKSKSVKELVTKLRGFGKTYSEIQKKLNVRIPKSTLSSWCKNVKLPSIYYRKLKYIVQKNANNGRAMALVSNQILREKYLQLLSDRNVYLKRILKTKDVAKVALAMLYVGEGAKWKSHRGLELGSSSPEIISIYLKLLKLCYGIGVEKLRARIMHRADQSLNTLKLFWSKITGIPKNNFYNTKPDQRTIGTKTRKEYRGVCIISGGGTEVQLELGIIAKMFLEI